MDDIKEQKEYIKKINKLNRNRNLKYAILTMGCQLNENDSEKICGMLEEMGYEKTDNFNEANFAIFNTCCVRENAEDKLFGKLGELKNIKEQNGMIIAIGGCMMQEKNMIKRINKSYKYVDIVFGTHTIQKLPQDVYEVLANKLKIEDILDIDGEVYEGLPIKRFDKNKASVTIMYGCNNFCSYCIVPYVRGRERSRNPHNIIKEIESLAKSGYKEITLLGQNVNSYLVSERSKNPKLEYLVEIKNKRFIINSFATLLVALNEIEGIEKIRFISPHPKDFTDDVIEAIAKCDKVSKFIHLPLQSGSTKMLKIMNRKYTKEQYLTLVDKMKKKIPNVKFSTDIIVGFAGETEEDFKDTLDVVKKVKYEQVFMFIYSIREGTIGAKMENQIPENIKHERFDKLKKLVESQIEDNNKKYINTIQRVMVEGKSKTNEEMLTARTDSNKVIVFKGDKKIIGNMVNIKIISEHLWYLKGEVI